MSDLTLAALLGDMSAIEFTRDFWGQKALLVNSSFDPNSVRPADILALLNERAIYDRENVRVSAIDPTRPSERGDQRIAKDPSDARSALRSGYGITINRVERHLDRRHPLRDLHGHFSRTIGCHRDDLQIAAFFTPPLRLNFGMHSDRDHVFTLQLEGTKDWEIEYGDSVVRASLHPGSFFYLPFGVRHRVTASKTFCLSIAVIARPQTFRDAMMEAFLQLLDESGDRRFIGHVPLPLGWIEGAAARDSIALAALPSLTLNAARVGRAFDALAVQVMPGLELDVASLPDISVECLSAVASPWVRKTTAPVACSEFRHRLIVAVQGYPQLSMPLETRSAVDFVLSRKDPFRSEDLPDVFHGDTKKLIVERMIAAGLLIGAARANPDGEG